MNFDPGQWGCGVLLLIAAVVYGAWCRAKPETLADDDPRIRPDWTKRCEVCGASPIVPLTGLCGPCTFGEADTSGGNW